MLCACALSKCTGFPLRQAFAPIIAWRVASSVREICTSTVSRSEIVVQLGQSLRMVKEATACGHCRRKSQADVRSSRKNRCGLHLVLASYSLLHLEMSPPLDLRAVLYISERRVTNSLHRQIDRCTLTIYIETSPASPDERPLSRWICCPCLRAMTAVMHLTLFIEQDSALSKDDLS